MTETFYDVLDVAPDASTSDIEAAYRERIKATHPDRNDDEDADEKTQRVIEARDVLTDDDERARYDDIGHSAYVGEGDGSGAATDASGDGSAAAQAAREAGWGDAETEGPSQSSAAHTNAGRYERRHREAAASERVRQERFRDASADRAAANGAGDPTDSGPSSSGTSESSTGGTTTDGGPTGETGGARASAAKAARSQQKREQIYDAGAWSASTEYNVRKNIDPGIHPLRLLVSGTSLSLVALTFFLYPVMLFSTVFPPFPLVVNVTIGLCTLFLIGYLQSQPSVGIIVFGSWSVLVPLALFAFSVDPTGVVGLIALAGAWLPLGFSALTMKLLRF